MPAKLKLILKPGNYDGKIKLIFSDNSEKILPVKIVVKIELPWKFQAIKS